MAVFTFPLRQGDNQLGALDMYRDVSGPLDAGAMMAAQTLADVAAAYVCGTRTYRRSRRMSATRNSSGPVLLPATMSWPMSVFLAVTIPSNGATIFWKPVNSWRRCTS